MYCCIRRQTNISIIFIPAAEGTLASIGENRHQLFRQLIRAKLIKKTFVTKEAADLRLASSWLLANVRCQTLSNPLPKIRKHFG
jgi:uncharacterized membrane protein